MDKLMLKVLVVFGLFMANADAANVKGMRFWQSPDSTRVVLDMTGPSQHSIFTLQDPHRMVIDLKGAALSFDPADLDIKSSLVQHVRTSEGDNAVRVVLDLKRSVSFKSFELEPYQNYGHRLVVDLLDENNQEEAPKAKTVNASGKRDIVVAIDAGHGGDDPGAVGAKGTLEKNIALSVAKQLASKIDATPGMKAVLVRKGDYFINLRKRTQIARQNQADIFVSIHADGFHDKRARGSSVWVVSPKGAESEMGRWLEQRENESDLLGGVESLSNKDPLLAKVLLDLSTSYSVSASLDAATQVHNRMSKVVPKMHKKRVERAAFVVLKMPDIPAMLVELAFISNPQEEKLLRSKAHRDKLAGAIFDGLQTYFKANPPDGTLMASQRVKPSHYTIKSGDTLSDIAARFNLSIAELKRINQLKSDSIKVGQRLKLAR